MRPPVGLNPRMLHPPTSGTFYSLFLGFVVEWRHIMMSDVNGVEEAGTSPHSVTISFHQLHILFFKISTFFHLSFCPFSLNFCHFHSGCAKVQSIEKSDEIDPTPVSYPPTLPMGSSTAPGSWSLTLQCFCPVPPRSPNQCAAVTDFKNMTFNSHF